MATNRFSVMEDAVVAAGTNRWYVAERVPQSVLPKIVSGAFHNYDTAKRNADRLNAGRDEMIEPSITDMIQKRVAEIAASKLEAAVEEKVRAIVRDEMNKLPLTLSFVGAAGTLPNFDDVRKIVADAIAEERAKQGAATRVLVNEKVRDAVAKLRLRPL